MMWFKLLIVPLNLIIILSIHLIMIESFIPSSELTIIRLGRKDLVWAQSWPDYYKTPKEIQANHLIYVHHVSPDYFEQQLFQEIPMEPFKNQYYSRISRIDEMKDVDVDPPQNLKPPSQAMESMEENKTNDQEKNDNNTKSPTQNSPPQQLEMEKEMKKNNNNTNPSVQSSPPEPPIALAMASMPEPEEKCDGFDNFQEDLGLMTYTLGIFLSGVGISSLIVGIYMQIYTYFSVYGIAVPSSLLLFKENVPPAVQSLFDGLGIFDTIVNVIILVPLGDILNVVGFWAEVLSCISILIDTAGAFPELTETYLELFLGLDADALFEGYGCNNSNQINFKYLNLWILQVFGVDNLFIDKD